MQVFWNIVRLAFRQQLTYRVAILAGMVTNLFFGLLRVALLIALYQGRSEVNSLDVSGAITFIALSQSLIAFLEVFGSFGLMDSVYTGSIGSDLIKPLNLFTLWLGRDFGRSLVNLLGRGGLFALGFMLFYPLKLPPRLESWLALPFALILGWLTSFAWRFLVNMAAFWSPDGRAIGRGLYTFSQFFSGFIIPLRILPDWFSHLAHYTPFPAMLNTPIEIYLGVISGQEILTALLFQTIWFGTLVLVGQGVYRLGIRRLVIQGG
ncbi:MAG TPA: ABC-2 family transporter protein [Anaerolineaceae bacterium]